MRRPEDFVREYRRKGYSDERIRVVANMTREPLRRQVLAILDEAAARPKGKQPAAPPPAEESRAAAPPEGRPEREPAPSPEWVSRVGRRETDATRAAELDRLREAVKTLQAKLNAAESERAGLEAKLQSYAQEPAAPETEGEGTDAMAAELRQTRGELADLRGQLGQKDEAIETAQAECQEAVSRATELAESLREVRRESEELRERLAEREAEVRDLRSERAGSPPLGRADGETTRLRRQAARYRKMFSSTLVTAGVVVIVLILLFALPGGENGPSSGAPAAGGVGGTDVHRVTPETPGEEVRTYTWPPGERTPAQAAGSEPDGPETPAGPERGVAAEPEVIRHTVAQGETLWDICREHLGRADPETLERVARENGLSDPNKITAGMELKLTVPPGSRPAGP